MKDRAVRSIGLVLAFTLAACAPKVAIDFDKDVDFARYHTYSWEAGTPVKNDLMDRRIIKAIDDQLTTKGYQKTETNPDMFVTYHAALSEEVYYNTTSMGVGYGPGWGPGYGWYGRGGGWGMASGTSVTTPNKVVTGTLNVDIYDAKDKQMIWRGTGSDTVSQDPEKNTEKIQEATAAMFEKFPPK
jgi:hypothetical protein